MKEYKTSEQLIEHLKDKHLIIENEDVALDIIDVYSYYSVINTYKQVFKKKDGNYIDNASFDEIYSLYKFDKNIRNIFLKSVLELELKVKGIMANVLAKNYGIKDYLNISNFDPNVSKDDVDKVLKSLNDEINKNMGKHPAITHYQEEYGFIPPFVLLKVLSLGEISRLYGLLKQSDKQEISKRFNISDKLLKQILINMTMARNICAHSDRLFTYHSKFFMSFKLIEPKYSVNNTSTNLYMLIRSFKLFLTNIEYDDMTKEIENEYSILNNSVKSIDTNVILNIMGFVSNKI